VAKTSLNPIFFWGHSLKKSDIDSIEFTNILDSFLFHEGTLVGKNRYCKIIPNNEKFPKWFAFLSKEEDIKKLKEFDYLN